MRRGYEPARPHSAVRAQGARAWAGPPSARHAATGPAAAIGNEVGRFFQDLRRAFRISQAQAAQRLATRVDIVAALEAGQIGGLPPWPETCRIVRTYAGLAGLDPRPILHSMELLFTMAPRPPVSVRQNLLPRLGRQGAPLLAALGTGRKAALNAATRGVDAMQHRNARTGLALSAAAVFVALVVLVTQTSVLEAAVSQLPPSVARIVRGAHDYVIVRMAPVRDGLRWIDVSDPRSRRSDKLQTTARSD
jgi:hypothetical protein